MTNREQIEKLIDAMSAAYSDPEVKKDSHMHQLLFDSAKQLTNGNDHRVICVRLSKEIGRFSLRNNLKAPQSLNDLYELVRKEHMSYRGTIAATTLWWRR
ncbi:bacteriocin immunity protein [Alkalibacterium putridalgicola]|uniref:bacteriocin immunity protein n=1 Tax=Alkalibacterium putridalgicola TaxID=426703 RepID=UPI0034CF94A3